MHKIRKLYKRYLIIIIVICIVYFLIVNLLTEPKEYTDSKYKLGVIEEGIHSDDNHKECLIPNVPIYSAEMLQFIKEVPLIDCGGGGGGGGDKNHNNINNKDWAVCEKSMCFIKQDVIDVFGEITCDFMDIIRKDDFTIEFGAAQRTQNIYMLKQSDFVKVKCWTNKWDSYWSGVLYGIRENVQKTRRLHQQPKPQPLPKKSQSQPQSQHPQLNPIHNPESYERLNVLMYGFDSLSKNAFIRKLKKSYKYLMHTLNADILNGYNIVGDGTPQALIPLLTGSTELELPEVRKRISDSKFVDDVYPMIWNEYEQMGYVTGFNEDVPNIGTFTYRLNGFQRQPTHHYMRPFYQVIDMERDSFKKLCIGQHPRHISMLDYTKQFMLKYRYVPNFIFSFHGELSHDSINLIGVADGDLENWLKDLRSNGILNNTILIMMSDHGNRFAKVRDTLQGKLEERLPFFAFVFPEWFKKKYHQKYGNFKKNLNLLTTPFDVHATLQEILYLRNEPEEKSEESRRQRSNHVENKVLLPLNTSLNQNQNKNNSSSSSSSRTNRAISLFNKIPLNRSCADAYIEPHWCACLNWKQLNLTNGQRSMEVKKSAITILNTINDYTTEYRDICSKLTLHDIKWAGKLLPHTNLLNFKQNKDIDGFLADLTATKLGGGGGGGGNSGNSGNDGRSSATIDLYQIKIVVNPGKSIFEGTVVHDLTTNRFLVKISDISRVNQYGEQAKCILDTNPDLRKFCYCMV